MSTDLNTAKHSFPHWQHLSTLLESHKQGPHHPVALSKVFFLKARQLLIITNITRHHHLNTVLLSVTSGMTHPFAYFGCKDCTYSWGQHSHEREQLRQGTHTRTKTFPATKPWSIWRWRAYRKPTIWSITINTSKTWAEFSFNLQLFPWQPQTQDSSTRQTLFQYSCNASDPPSHFQIQ